MNIDERAIGRLEGRMDALETLVQDQGAKIDELLALANRSRGGFWVGMAFASAFGGFATFLVSLWRH